MTSRDDLVYMAKFVEQAERFDEMVDHMKAVAQQPKELSVEECNLLSVAYKNVIGLCRASWRVISSIEGKDTVSDQLPLICDYKSKIEMELIDICDDILKIIEAELIPNSTSEEGKVFYYKMKGDYYWYLVEFQSAEDRKASVFDVLDVYKSVFDLVNQDLPPIHPIRLGLALNFSVFYYEILNSPECVCNLVKAAFDDAIVEFDIFLEESYKDSTLIMQLLRDNLILWTLDQGEAEEVFGNPDGTVVEDF